MKRLYLSLFLIFGIATLGCYIPDWEIDDNWDDDGWDEPTPEPMALYEVTIESAQIEALNPSTGQSWDPNSGPDPCLMLWGWYNWDVTPIAFQETEPNWNYTMYFDYDELDSLELLLADEDQPGDDNDDGEPHPDDEYDDDDEDNDDICDEIVNIQPDFDSSEVFEISPVTSNGLINLVISVRPAQF